MKNKKDSRLNIKKILYIVLLGLSYCFPTLALAVSNFEKTAYIGLGAGISKIVPETNNTGYVVDNDSDAAYKIFAGYDFNKRFGVEAFYTDLGTATFDNQGNTALRSDGFIDYASFGASILWYFWHSVDDSLYNKRYGWQASIGAGLSSLKNGSNLNHNHVSDAQGHLSANLEYGLANGFSVRAGVDAFDTDAMLFSVSIIQRFGEKTTARAIVKKPKTIKPQTKPKIKAIKKVVSPVVKYDSDKDGVLDNNDKCPNTPKNTKVNKKGCAYHFISLDMIHFDSNSSILSHEAKVILRKAVQALSARSDTRMEVKAYTDSIDSSKYNLWLSKRRASRVRLYLISLGVSANRIIMKSFGEVTPVDTNATRDGRYKNRRVELKIVK